MTDLATGSGEPSLLQLAARNATHLLDFLAGVGPIVQIPGIVQDPNFQLVSRHVSAGLLASVLSENDPRRAMVIDWALHSPAGAGRAGHLSATQMSELVERWEQMVEQMATICALADAATEPPVGAVAGLVRVLGVLIAASNISAALTPAPPRRIPVDVTTKISDAVQRGANLVVFTQPV